MTLFNVFSLLGGLALFLFGMDIMGKALEKQAGGHLQKILSKLTDNPLKGFFLGLCVTAIIQSSSATTVMVVGFVNSGIMELHQAIGIIMGSNVGTTVTSWLLSLSGLQGDSFLINMLKPTSFSPVLAFIGILLYMGKSEKRKGVGTILIGFAVLMTGMTTMSNAVLPLQNEAWFTSLFIRFSNPLLGVLVGAVVTGIIQSSSASVGILQALSATGVITYGSAIPIIMGQNIGTCVTALISSVGANKNARRAAMVHLYFNIIGVTLFLAVFYGANLLLLAASLCVGFPVLRDGLNGLRGRSSSETMPALAAVAALVQAVTAMLNANVYRGTTGISLLSGMAALGLFLALLGSRVMLAAVKGGYELVTNGVEFEGAYRAKDKDLLRALARDLEQKDPWVLLSRPMKEADGFVEQSLSERASERRARKVSYILLGVALLSGVLFLLAGAGWNKAAAAMAAVLCMGAPLSSTLIAGVASLRLQRAATAVGAVVPGWQAIEQLGGIDTLQVDADDLFTADSALLEDIRIFKGGRIDRAILYAASVLNAGCGTLQGLFRQIVEDRTDILFPVKDLEEHNGLGFVGWCDNNRILIGNRKYLEQEGVPLPDEEYEAEHSKNGELQILYLAVSGSLHAMFVLRYVGGRNTARSLAALQKENIRLLVTCRDPSLTARHISEAYHLPEGMVTLLDQEQCDAIAAAPIDPADPCCMIHAQNFASLTGGLQAADQAQNAETSATTVQLVSVWFSVAIAVLLTYAGSVGMLSVAAVLMYQAAWSALSIAVCALKQHS